MLDSHAGSALQLPASTPWEAADEGSSYWVPAGHQETQTEFPAASTLAIAKFGE